MNTLRDFVRSLGWAINGLRYGLRTQRNLKIQAVCTVLAIAISLWLGMSATEWAILILILAGVMAGEMLNTALEATLDLISREQNPQIGLAKDVAAGAVLVWAMASLLIALCLWGPKLTGLIRGQYP